MAVGLLVGLHKTNACITLKRLVKRETTYKLCKTFIRRFDSDPRLQLKRHHRRENLLKTKELRPRGRSLLKLSGKCRHGA
jgi:hypothetical protein